jgi:quercetin dioxygenase-like cupin family protein
MAHHIVKPRSDFLDAVPDEFRDHQSGYSTVPVVSESGGAVQMGFQVSTLESQGTVETHLHSFEESFYVISGTLVVDYPEGSYVVSEGDYGLIPVGTPHALRNPGDESAHFAEMRAPLPRRRLDNDTYFPASLEPGAVRPVDVRDPRNRLLGHIDVENMDPALQTQDRLALSASMRTALLVYSGISVKMMVDSDLGADLSTMFMVQYEPGGFAGAHDHPLEEAYLILEGEVEAKFDDVAYRLVPGDVAWAGVGCVHEFANAGEGVVRWLETQAPQPPPRHSYRFARDWAYLENAIATENGSPT